MNDSLEQAYELQGQADDLKERDPDRAATLYRQAIALLEGAGEAREALETTHWLMQTLNCFGGRYREALDVGVRAVVKAKGPQYADFTTRICLHEDLISAYIGVDPEGYEREIRDLLDYMRGEISPAMQCGFCLRYRNFDLELWCENFAVAHDIALSSLGSAQGGWYGDWHRVGYLSELCEVACLSGLGAEQIGEWARELERLARRNERTSHYAESAMLLAAAHRLAGDEAAAKKETRRARSAFTRHGESGFENYFTAARYHAQLAGEWDKVAALCEAELQILAGKSAPARMARVHRWKCQALHRAGTLDAQSLDLARQIAAGLRAPHAELARLNKLAAQVGT